VIIRLLKEKLVYAIVGLIYVVHSAMSYNEKFNADKVAAYYSSFGSYKSSQPIIEADASEIVAFAKEQLGKPYQIASKGPDGFDCSGFTFYVFKNFDIYLPASAKAQAFAGEAVANDSLNPGDLVLFKGVNLDMDRIGHVGIVTAVSTDSVQFIHSSTSRGVMLNDLKNDDYYKARYKGARRVIGN